ncbi:MAG: hypothetical protein KAR40_15010 [Candidatus Sabulitectum sp.]|nr:hypothetical protein [Candidatus Sabulitectum sp.]
MSVLALLILAMIAFGGTYTIEEHYHPGMPDSHGMMIQDNDTDRLWISDYWTGEFIEFDMTTGNVTGNVWDCYPRPTDVAFCEYEGVANQYLLGHFDNNHIEIYDESTTGANPYLNGFIAGPSSWEKVYGVAAGDGMIYVTTPLGGIIAWAE